MDYRLTDPYLDPPGQADHLYTERSVRLETFWCYDPLCSGPPVQPLPADANGYVTFGCLNNFAKVNTGVLEAWREILTAVPESRLLILPPPGATCARVVQALGVDPARIDCQPRQSREAYLALHNRIDLALDPFPYVGHTTAIDGLWMGVPVVSMYGTTVVSRATLSMLSNLGLQELCAAGKAEYVALAIQLARDLPRLRRLRQELRPRLQRSVLMDAPRFARRMETAYEQMWQDWCGSARAT